MNKIRLSSMAIALMVLMLVPSVAFAQDPPDLDVDIGIGTSGDVDLDIDINAGGDVDVTIDGVGLDEALAEASRDKSSPENNHFMWDYTYYWRITGIGDRIEGQIAELQQISGLLLDANAKLILLSGQSTEKQRNLATRLAELNSETDESLCQLKADADSVVESLQTRDDEIWNQLMYGAEAHIAILDAQLVVQESQISSLQAESALLKAQIETADTNNYALRNYVDYLQRQYLYYFWIIGGVMVLLSVLLFTLHLRNRR